jgi:16S rRNA (cytosine1402-N4)-methyltransferase
MTSHKPVLLKEVLDILKPQPGQFFIDGTLGGGGHAFPILKSISPGGIFLGVDWNKELINEFKSKIDKEEAGKVNKLFFAADNFKNMLEILKNNRLSKADGLILDLGLSSLALEQSGRGFSFLRAEPLLMTYSENLKPAYEWLKQLKEKELAKIIKDFGEERFAAKIARAIKTSLPIFTTADLVAAIKKALPKNYERGRLHPATRTFQALRIFVNQELENLEHILWDLPKILVTGGRALVIAFHSLEDRIVKNVFRNLVKAGRGELLTKKPITPRREEVLTNPRSRSAKLRAIKII